MASLYLYQPVKITMGILGIAREAAAATSTNQLAPEPGGRLHRSIIEYGR